MHSHVYGKNIQFHVSLKLHILGGNFFIKIRTNYILIDS